jgi:CDP-glucose 4,6-dehydratase
VEVVGVTRTFWDRRRVFLTGHTGFKGSWLALWLADLGAEVVGYANGIPTTPSLYETASVGDAVSWVEGDVRDREALERALHDARPEVVFHLAAQPLVRRSYEIPLETYETNVIGTANVLEASRHATDVRVVVNVTTDKVYENRAEVGGEWIWGYREGEPLGGHDVYSSSKACSELVTAAYRASFFAQPGAPVIATARAGNVIGGGDWSADRLVPDLIEAARSRQPAEIRNPSSTRPWQHVLNATSGYLTLAEQAWDDRALGRAWNFGPDDADAQPVATLVERLAALWEEGFTWLETREPQPAEAAFLKLDSSLARLRLGWRPKWNLDRALRSIVDWYHALDADERMDDVCLAQIRAYEADVETAPVLAR